MLVEYWMRIKKPDLQMQEQVQRSLLAIWHVSTSPTWSSERGLVSLLTPNQICGGQIVGWRRYVPDTRAARARQINTCGVENYVNTLQLFWCNGEWVGSALRQTLLCIYFPPSRLLVRVTESCCSSRAAKRCILRPLLALHLAMPSVSVVSYLSPLPISRD